MLLDEWTVATILECVNALPLWLKYSKQAAVVLTGSIPAGLSDDQSDIDVEVLVPEPAFAEMYEPLWKAVDEGAINVYNPRARLFHEYPIIALPEIDGHYRVKSAEQAETRIREMDDVIRWIYSNSEAIYDKCGLHARLRSLARTYPDGVASKKRGPQLWAAKEYYYALKLPLQRNQRESILLLGTQSVSHLLKFFCLCDEKPFPYEKWLYKVAMGTRLGCRTKDTIEAIMAELGRENVVREQPHSYVEPGDREEEYENYRLYHLFKLLLKEINEFRREHYPNEVK